MRSLTVSFLAIVIPMAVGVVDSAAQERAATAIARLRPGQLVRLSAPGTVVESGTVTGVDGETLYVSDEGQEWIIQARDIERLEVRKRAVVSNALTFGAIGAVVGFAADKLRGSPQAGIRGGPSDASSDGAGKGALAGVAFGIAFGFTQWRWAIVFPR